MGSYCTVGIRSWREKRVLSRMRERAKETDDALPTKNVRCDKGQYLFDSAKVQRNYLSAAQIWKKSNHTGGLDLGLVAGKRTIAQFESLPTDVKNIFEEESKKQNERVKNLWSEAVMVLRQAKGALSWRDLARQLSENGRLSYQVVSHETLRKTFMRNKDFEYKSTKLIPLLTKFHEKKRFDWSQNFFAFWHMSSLLAPSVQLCLCDQDEKWFYALVARNNIKSIPSIGVFPHKHMCGNKHHIHKIMVTCTTGFLPRFNRFELGGTAIKISFDRVGVMETAKRTSYKRTTRPDGTFYYNKTEANISRRKGSSYFKPCEVTGSKESVGGKPKFSLMKYYAEVEIPRLDRIAQEYESVNPGSRLIIRYNSDGAGPHNDLTFKRFLFAEFDRRGWLLTKQPPHSPICNTNDSSIFPSMSKKLSARQAVVANSHALNGENLWLNAEKIWKDLPLSVVASAYVHKQRVVAAIFNEKGGDSFQRGPNAMHFGVRGCFIPTVHGVETIETYVCDDDNNNDSMLAKPTHPLPDASKVDVEGNLGIDEIRFALRHLPEDHSRRGVYERAYQQLQKSAPVEVKIEPSDDHNNNNNEKKSNSNNNNNNNTKDVLNASDVVLVSADGQLPIEIFRNEEHAEETTTKKKKKVRWTDIFGEVNDERVGRVEASVTARKAKEVFVVDNNEDISDELISSDMKMYRKRKTTTETFEQYLASKAKAKVQKTTGMEVEAVPEQKIPKAAMKNVPNDDTGPVVDMVTEEDAAFVLPDVVFADGNHKKQRNRRETVWFREAKTFVDHGFDYFHNKFTCYNVSPDGNCGFHALVCALEDLGIHDEVDNALELRKTLYEYALLHPHKSVCENQVPSRYNTVTEYLNAEILPGLYDPANVAAYTGSVVTNKWFNAAKVIPIFVSAFKVPVVGYAMHSKDRYPKECWWGIPTDDKPLFKFGGFREKNVFRGMFDGDVVFMALQNAHYYYLKEIEDE